MTTRPEFDPARSAAIRSLLVQTAAASGPTTTSGHPRRRALVVVTLAVVTGLLASGTAAVALMGGSLFDTPAPAMTTGAPTPTPTPTSTPTPTPTPTPTQPPTPTAPVVRVPATCDQLLPQSAAEAISGLPLTATPEGDFSNPVYYTDRRVGTLTCGWQEYVRSSESAPPRGVSLSVYPDVTAEGFLAEVNREGIFSSIGQPETEVGPEAYSACGTYGTAYDATWCSYIGRVNGYAITVGAAGGADLPLSDVRVAEVRELFVKTMAHAASFSAPPALWQPPGTIVAGATSCDGLADPSVLADLLGVDAVREIKNEAGEYANAHFLTSLQAGAYWCSWTVDDPTATANAFAAVLPGGATYFAASAAQDPSPGWTLSPDYPGEAYISANGTQVSVLIDGAWVEVRAPAASLRALTDVVLANVGAG